MATLKDIRLDSELFKTEFRLNKDAWEILVYERRFDISPYLVLTLINGEELQRFEAHSYLIAKSHFEGIKSFGKQLEELYD